MAGYILINCSTDIVHNIDDFFNYSGPMSRTDVDNSPMQYTNAGFNLDSGRMYNPKHIEITKYIQKVINKNIENITELVDRNNFILKIKPKPKTHYLFEIDRYREMIRFPKNASPYPTMHIDSRTESLDHLGILYSYGNTRHMIIFDLEKYLKNPQKEIAEILEKYTQKQGFPIEKDDIKKLKPYMKKISIPKDYCLILDQSLPHCVTSECDDNLVCIYSGITFGTMDQLEIYDNDQKTRLLNGDVNRNYQVIKYSCFNSEKVKNAIEHNFHPEIRKRWGNKEGYFTPKYQPPSRKSFITWIEEKRKDDPEFMIHVSIEHDGPPLAEDMEHFMIYPI